MRLIQKEIDAARRQVELGISQASCLQMNGGIQVKLMVLTKLKARPLKRVYKKGDGILKFWTLEILGG